jgi:hypothetical protein
VPAARAVYVSAATSRYVHRRSACTGSSAAGLLGGGAGGQVDVPRRSTLGYRSCTYIASWGFGAAHMHLTHTAKCSVLGRRSLQCVRQHQSFRLYEASTILWLVTRWFQPKANVWFVLPPCKQKLPSAHHRRSLHRMCIKKNATHTRQWTTSAKIQSSAADRVDHCSPITQKLKQPGFLQSLCSSERPLSRQVSRPPLKSVWTEGCAAGRSAFSLPFFFALSS